MILSHLLTALLVLTLGAGAAFAEKPADLAGLLQMAQSQEEFEALVAQPRTAQASPAYTCEQVKRTISSEFAGETEAAQPSAETLPEVDVKIHEQVKAATILEATEITFAFDSAELTEEGKATVRRLGAVLANTPGPYCLAIYGHTDAKGTDTYNQKLSEERAAAVRNVLISEFGIKEQDLAVYGFGEKKLKYKSKPYDPANRRVELQNLLGG